MQQIEGEAVRFNMSGPDAPTIVNDSSDGSSTYVLMPMRVWSVERILKSKTFKIKQRIQTVLLN